MRRRLQSGSPRRSPQGAHTGIGASCTSANRIAWALLLELSNARCVLSVLHGRAQCVEEPGAQAGDTSLVDSEGSVVVGSGKLVALVDVPGVTVIDTPDALLVVSRKNAERVREVVTELRRRRREDLL